MFVQNPAEEHFYDLYIETYVPISYLIGASHN